VIIKIVTFFLIGIVILGMFGKLKYPGRDRLRAARCLRCGRFLLGNAPCKCGAKKGS